MTLGSGQVAPWPASEPAMGRPSRKNKTSVAAAIIGFQVKGVIPLPGDPQAAAELEPDLFAAARHLQREIAD